MTTDEVFPIRLTPDEALVLSDWLHRHSTTPEFAALIDDRAVWMPILKIGGTLETTLPEIFHPDYGKRLEAAQERLIAQLGDFGADPGPGVDT